MIEKETHDLHRRRRGRNWAVLAVLGGLALLIFAVTIVKLMGGGMIEGY